MIILAAVSSFLLCSSCDKVSRKNPLLRIAGAMLFL
jgi:hypothetical protein